MGAAGACIIADQVRALKGCFPPQYTGKDLDLDGVGSWNLTRVAKMAQRGPVGEVEREEQGRKVALLRL